MIEADYRPIFLKEQEFIKFLFPHIPISHFVPA